MANVLQHDDGSTIEGSFELSRLQKALLIGWWLVCAFAALFSLGSREHVDFFGLSLSEPVLFLVFALILRLALQVGWWMGQWYVVDIQEAVRRALIDGR